ncbi:protein of unknown function [Methylocaldum szegediense]|uniref:HEPN domain-containing protein n=1 Tax=Methylocaldum szegediense TaxID=73780 RepID=A0ABN8X1A1_9GAMM|nr:protein of unknown function [Methylocaldum szegediense]
MACIVNDYPYFMIAALYGSCEIVKIRLICLGKCNFTAHSLRKIGNIDSVYLSAFEIVIPHI